MTVAGAVLVPLVSAVINLLILAIVVRAIASWVRPQVYSPAYHRFMNLLEAVTEPVLAPIRRVVPPVGPGIDFSPLVAVILLEVVRTVLIRLLYFV